MKKAKNGKTNTANLKIKKCGQCVEKMWIKKFLKKIKKIFKKVLQNIKSYIKILEKWSKVVQSGMKVKEAKKHC
ncbi:MAG: hypothetical protein IJJ82_06815 [Clostridia bacterium]|nr:hypothetical protein [Clostridia bacterium]